MTSIDLDALSEVRTVRGREYLFRVETSSRPADYLKYERLRNAIWDFAEDALPGSRNMMSENYFHDGGSLFIGVFAGDGRGGFPVEEGALIGFSYGFVGVRDSALGFRDPANLWFYSQYAGVRPGFERRGLGVPIKEFQKKILLEVLGIGAVVCTYDPLTGVNARRNIHRLGMDVLEYREDTYGAFGGRLNRADLPSDRFFAHWDLRRSAPRSGFDLEPLVAAGADVVKTDEVEVAGRSGPRRLEVLNGLALDAAPDPCLVRIPADFYEMLRETDTGDARVRRIPLDWRFGTRTAFLALFGRGYRVVDFLCAGDNPRRNFYVLKREEDVR
jgi:predicted GNAT superfamily acetyltransferase